MQRTVLLGLVALTLFFVAFPLSLARPGAPATLKADEGAYHMMALSLAHDGDLVLAAEDSERLFHDFPFRWVSNLILMTDDGWRTVYYGKPYVYSLFAAPLTLFFGAHGLLLFNMALMMGMVWMGTVYLRRFNDDGTAALFAALFFLLSSAFAYVFWIQTEVFNMAAVCLACFLGLGEGQDGLPRPLWQRALSGAALALAVYNKPVFAALALPLLLQPLLRRRWAAGGGWLLGFVLCLGAVAGGAVALTGHPTPYLGVVRQGATLCEPGVIPVEPLAVTVGAGPGSAGTAGEEAALAGSNSPTGNAWSWLFRIPEVPPAALAENLGYFLWGRHTGLLLYLPFSLLAVALFLLRGRRSGERWLLLASLAIVALFFLVFISFNWHGGGGFIGNRYFVNVYPAFLFLVTEVRPRWPLALGAGLAGLFLAPVLFTPLSSVGPEPTLQHHVRSPLHRHFPLELSLRNVPGYQRQPWGGVRMIVRKDQGLPMGDQLWVRAADRVEVWMIAAEPLQRGVFQVHNLAPHNRVTLDFEGREKTVSFDAGEQVQRVVLDPEGPGRVRHHPEGPLYVYRLEVETESGRNRSWTRVSPPTPCPYFAENLVREEDFPVGAILTYLGDGAELEADLYAVEWREARTPEQVAAKSRFEVPVSLVNASSRPWPNQGPARVKLSYHWLDVSGDEVVFDGRRSELPTRVAPGAAVETVMEVEAPPQPGRYLLELDPVFEHVAWFSQRNGRTTFRTPVEVLPTGGAGAPPTGAPAAGESPR